MSSEEGAICGGEVTILIDVSPQDHTQVFQNIARSLNQGQPGVLATFIEKQAGGNISITRYWIEMGENFAVDSEASYTRFSEQIKKSLMDNKPDLIRVDETLLFLEPIYPLPRLVIAGAGHVGQAVCHMGGLLDFQVTVIDDRNTPSACGDTRLAAL
jgi:xanthine dehydrogenase accessory factor